MLDGRVDDGLVLENLEERAADLLPSGVLGEIPARTRPERIEHRPVVGVGGQHHDLDQGLSLAQLAGGLDAVAAGHPQVHQHHVGVKRTRHGDGLGPVRGFTHHLDVGEEPEHHGQSLADDPLIIGDQNTDRLAHTGTSSSTRKPWQVDSVTSDPPRSSALSRMPVRP